MSPMLDRRQRHVTATGLFLLLILALIGVGMRMGSLASEPTALRDPLELETRDFREPPLFSVTDRNGQLLAQSVETFSIEASPFHLWLGHTPERIVRGLADALELDAPGAERLARDLMGLDGEGRIRVTRWPLTRDEAVAIAEWIRAGGPGNGAPLEGIELERVEDWPQSAEGANELERRRLELTATTEGPYYELVWEPSVLLSEQVRERALPSLARGRGRAARWVRALSDDLFALLEGPRERERAVLRRAWEADPLPFEQRPLPRCYELAADRVRRDGFLAGLRDLLVGPAVVPPPEAWVFVGPEREWVFDGLMPRRHALVVEQLDVARLEAVRDFIAEEQLSEYELALEPTSRRLHPFGELGVVGTSEWWSAVDALPGDPAVERPTRGLENLGYLLLREVEQREGDPRVPGSAGYHGRKIAQRTESGEKGPRGSEDARGEDGARPEPGPAPHLVSGSADRIERRLMRPRRPGEPHDYYLGRDRGLEPAEVVATLDVELQLALGGALEGVVEQHEASLAMGVVVDLQSREVLALDWRSPYRVTAFPPLQFGFTPGSTFKLVTAALALDAGVIRPDDVFDVGHGSHVVRETTSSGRVRTRTVHEAEGFASGRITAAECLAHSSNAGMVQIGHRVTVETWKSKTAELGYGAPACPELLASGLSNRAGRVGESEASGGDPWGLRRSHTSVSFGDSVTTTLLQHAQALATLLDDGCFRPLRFARAWQVDGMLQPIPAQQGRRVVSPEVPAQLRAMMRLGAAVGTGKSLERPEALVLHSKTGTTEKLAADVCSHKYWGAYTRALEQGEVFDDSAERRRLRGDFAPRRACYVSSICVMAASPTDGRPLMVLLVVDDPHGRDRFGSKVAGPAAVEVLCRALGLETEARVAEADPDAHRVLLERAGLLPWDQAEVSAIADGGAW